MRQERVTEQEIRAAIRAHGVTAVEDVHAIVLETDGSFSVMQHAGSSASALTDVSGYPSKDFEPPRPRG